MKKIEIEISAGPLECNSKDLWPPPLQGVTYGHDHPIITKVIYNADGHAIAMVLATGEICSIGFVGLLELQRQGIPATISKFPPR